MAKTIIRTHYKHAIGTEDCTWNGCWIDGTNNCFMDDVYRSIDIVIFKGFFEAALSFPIDHKYYKICRSKRKKREC